MHSMNNTKMKIFVCFLCKKMYYIMIYVHVKKYKKK